jgi:hypothetical protein
MNMRTLRVQEANRVKHTVQNQMRLNQTFDTANTQVNGYRSLGFYQAGRYTMASEYAIVGMNGGNKVS